jgi:DinB superfamily
MPLDPAVLETLRTMPQFVRDHANRAGTHGFTMVEHACHLRDLEKEGYLVRIERILREDNPALEDFEGGRIARERNYAAQDFGSAIDEFERSRMESVRVLQGLSDAELDRPARFGDDAITLRRLADMMVQHDAEHRAEIEEMAVNKR